MVGVPLILIIEDSTSVVDFCEFVLHHAGYRIAAASDGKLGSELAEELRPEVVLLDMMLPELDGLRVLDRLQRMPRPPRVVAMSGFERYEPEAMRRGAAAFLRKPVESRELLAVVAAVLSGARVEPALLKEQAERVAEQRRVARERREELLDRVDFTGEQERLRELVRWTTPYFGVAVSFVTIHRGSNVHCQAVFGSGFDKLEGLDVDEGMTFCTDVTAAGSPLLLTDAASNPAYAKHPAVGNFRFYAGTPIVTPRGVILGTLCLCDPRPRLLHGEDLTVLEALADGVGRRIEGLADGYDLPGASSRPACSRASCSRCSCAARGSASPATAAASRSPPSISAATTTSSTSAPPTWSTWPAGAERVAVAALHFGIAILVGDTSADACRGRVDRALSALEIAGIAVRGAGMVALVDHAPSAVDVVTLIALAEEASRRSEHSGGGLERVVLTRAAKEAQPSTPVDI